MARRRSAARLAIAALMIVSVAGCSGVPLDLSTPTPTGPPSSTAPPTASPTPSEPPSPSPTATTVTTTPPPSPTPSPTPPADLVEQLDAAFGADWRDGIEGTARYSLGSDECTDKQFETGARFTLLEAGPPAEVQYEQLFLGSPFNVLRGTIRLDTAFVADDSPDFDEVTIIGAVGQNGDLRIFGGNWGATEQAFAEVVARIRAGDTEGFEGVLAAIDAGDYDAAAFMLFGPLGPPSGTCFHLLELLFEE